MALTVEDSLQDRTSPKDVGRNLRQVRKQQGLSRGAAARSAGLTRRELAAYERGKVAVPESDLWCLAGSCGVDVVELLPRREPLRISPDLSTISAGDTIRRVRGPAEPDGLLHGYLDMIYELRNLPPGSPMPLRQPDLTALADALGGTPDTIEHRLVGLIGASPEEAARLRAMILPPRSLPSAPATDTPRVDPYASLLQPEASPAVDRFLAGPPPRSDVFAPPAASAPTASRFAAVALRDAPPATASDHGEPVGMPPDPFASNPPAPSGPSPSDPFAGPVDPLGTAASTMRDPFAAPLADDPLAPPPLPPDPFAAAPPPPVRAPELDPVTPTLEDSLAPGSNGTDAPSPSAARPPNGNGHRLADDPFAPHWDADAAGTARDHGAAPLGINVADAIVVDDPLAASTPRPNPATDVRTPVVAPIRWNADLAARADPAAAAPTIDITPRFERASAHWQIGGIFPATATADNGTFALRRADARWALTDLTAPGDCIIEAAYDLRAGSGFGIIFRASVDDGERITGYSFDIDPVAGGGGYLLRLWEDSRQHWRPLAQAPVADPARLYGRHAMRLALRADQLAVSVDGDIVLDVPALSRSTVELGRQPCRGERVGVQAWSTTEVTVESFRVASV